MPFVVMCSNLVERKICTVQTWTAGQPPRESEGSHPGAYAGVRPGEALHPAPIEYDRDVPLEPHAWRTRINKAGDAVAGNQVSITCGVRSLQLVDTQTQSLASTASPAREPRGGQRRATSEGCSCSVPSVVRVHRHTEGTRTMVSCLI